MKKLALALFVIVASSCSAAIDCLTDSKPEWERKTLSDGMRFQPYEQTVELYSDNMVTIREFDVDGNLPDGLMANFDGSTARISGTPKELGNFQLKLVVKVVSEDSDGNAGCERTISKTYKLRIN
ncbi:Ig domain-containing protein [Flavobacterium selenitireducens]|uniref:Ig domain-containing protein n=1 Tax=Flavobacterium selenitireducens TaxID=2722704 RepID=UPI00168BBEBC|nr:Ig domain-containing protein [Flavobacterium selenitireducens]MBD3583969.1 hypothetical protein [Flavobacterium selenitireducens]